MVKSKKLLDDSIEIQKALYEVILNELLISGNLEEAIMRVEGIGSLLKSLDSVTQLQNLLDPSQHSDLYVLTKQNVVPETS